MSAVLGLHYPRRCVLGTGESGDVAACCVFGVNGIGTTGVEDVPVVRQGGGRQRRVRKQTEEAIRRRSVVRVGAPGIGGAGGGGTRRSLSLLRNGDRIWVKRWGLERSRTCVGRVSSLSRRVWPSARVTGTETGERETK